MSTGRRYREAYETHMSSPDEDMLSFIFSDYAPCPPEELARRRDLLDGDGSEPFSTAAASEAAGEAATSRTG